MQLILQCKHYFYTHWETKKFLWLALLHYLLYYSGLEQYWNRAYGPLHVASVGQALKGLQVDAVRRRLPLCTPGHKRTQMAQPFSASLPSSVSPGPAFRCLSTRQTWDDPLQPFCSTEHSPGSEWSLWRPSYLVYRFPRVAVRDSHKWGQGFKTTEVYPFLALETNSLRSRCW